MAEVLTKQFTTRKQFRVGSHTARTLRMTISRFSCSLHALTVKHNQQCRSTKEERINNYDAVLSNVRTCTKYRKWDSFLEHHSNFGHLAFQILAMIMQFSAPIKLSVNAGEFKALVVEPLLIVVNEKRKTVTISARARYSR